MAADLAERLRRRILAEGPVTFAEFMEVALYDPEEGFYRSVPVGARGAFVTSPHISPVFGRLVATQVEDLWELLDRPDPFTVVEAGAGDGTLAAQILEHLPAGLRRTVRYVAVERSAGARAALTRLGVRVAERLEAGP